MYDWTQFDIHLFIEAVPEAVFGKWATSSGLESFFVKKCEVRGSRGDIRSASASLSEGDVYQWDWFFNYKSSGRILQVTPNRSLSFTFGKCSVAVELRPFDSGTFVHLRQAGMDLAEEDRVNLHLDCRCGWTYFLTNLKAVLEHGIDVRDKRPDTSRSLEIGFIPSL